MINFKEIYKVLEQNKLTSLFLYSIATDRQVKESDFNSVKPTNLTTLQVFIYDTIKNVILRLTQHDQKEWFRWSLTNSESYEKFLKDFEKDFAEIMKRFEKALEENNEKVIEDICIEEMNKLMQSTFKQFSKMISNLHASVLKKFIVYFFENGIDFTSYFRSILKMQIINTSNTVSDDELKSLWKKKIEETDNPKLKEHLIQLAKNLGIDLDY